MGERFTLSVTEPEIVYRLNRVMAAEGLRVMGPKTVKQQNWGDWFVIDVATGKLVERDVDFPSCLLIGRYLRNGRRSAGPGACTAKYGKFQSPKKEVNIKIKKVRKEQGPGGDEEEWRKGLFGIYRFQTLEKIEFWA